MKLHISLKEQITVLATINGHVVKEAQHQKIKPNRIECVTCNKWLYHSTGSWHTITNHSLSICGTSPVIVPVWTWQAIEKLGYICIKIFPDGSARVKTTPKY